MSDETDVDFEDLEELDMAAAMEQQAADETPEVVPEESRQQISARELEAVYDIPVQVSAVLGKSSMQVSQLLKLGRGAVVELDRKVGEAIDIYVNNRLVARGEVVIVDERLGVRRSGKWAYDRYCLDPGPVGFFWTGHDGPGARRLGQFLLQSSGCSDRPHRHLCRNPRLLQHFRIVRCHRRRSGNIAAAPS